MSDTVINLSSYTDGILTDLTSITLADEGGTYGVRRTDTGDVVVASGTAMTQLATGTYRRSFTDPAVDLTYEYSLAITTGGTTRYYTRIIAAGVSNNVYLIPTSGHYSSQAEVTRQLGQIAIDLMLEDWSSADTSDVWNDILTRVDQEIDLYIGHKYPLSSFSNSYLRRQATTLACHFISGRRGNPSLYIREANNVMETLRDIRIGMFNIPSLIPHSETGGAVRNYLMQSYHPTRPVRVDVMKSTGGSYSGMDYAYLPYLYSW